MGANSGIQWTTHTFNPWWGCVRVSPGCVHCYAETFSKRLGKKLWGPAATTPRDPASENLWAQPEKWNRAAEKAGERARVFCASMSDVFEDHPQVGPWRDRLFALIERTPHLDWQLLTKRPENVRAMVPRSWEQQDKYPRNVWIGTSVEDQQRADERVPVLLDIPARIRFLSCEPLIGPVDLRRWLVADMRADGGGVARLNRLRWCIIGGESGGGARPFDLAWARKIVADATEGGAAVFVKQLGGNVRMSLEDWRGVPFLKDRWEDGRAFLIDSKGGDPDEWPADLRVREFPVAPTARIA